MKEVNFKVGQTYICTKDINNWFTKGERYAVITGKEGLVIVDNDGEEWEEYDINTDFYNSSFECFELVTVDDKPEEEDNMNKVQLKEGQIYKCISNLGLYFTKGKLYKLTQGEYNLELVDDKGQGWHVNAINYFVGKYFEIIYNKTKSNNMTKLTLKEGELYRCIKDYNTWFTKGNIYPVVRLNDACVLFDNDNDEWYNDDLNGGESNKASECFELVTVDYESEEEDNMTKLTLRAGELYRCTSDLNNCFTEGQLYPVFRGIKELVLVDDTGNEWTTSDLSNEFYHPLCECFELVTVDGKPEEEDNMKDITFKDGQTYKCIKDVEYWFTKGTKYPVVALKDGLALIDDEGDEWYKFEIDSDEYNNFFEYFELVTVDDESEKEPTHTITVYYPNNEKLTFKNIVSVDEYDEGEMVMSDINGDEHVVYLKTVIAYSTIENN